MHPRHIEPLLAEALTDTGARVAGYGLSVTYDFGNYFARLTRDPYANFTDASQTRVSLGLRF